jgi:hypothetical protein
VPPILTPELQATWHFQVNLQAQIKKLEQEQANSDNNKVEFWISNIDTSLEILVACVAEN